MKLDPSLYPDNLQTFIKHYVLMHYLETVAYKTLAQRYSSFVYIDGFSGPWKSKDEKYQDTSFGLAIQKLSEVRKTLYFNRNRKTSIKCVFVEKTQKAFRELELACADVRGINVRPIHGRFEDSVDEILEFIGPSRDTFVFTFVDPTGWKVDLQKLAPLLSRQPGEVIFNFMFDHINRFNQTFPETFQLLFADQDWLSKLDRSLSPSDAVTKLFGERLKDIGQFNFTAATEVLKATSDRTHFHLFYSTRSIHGLTVFRDIQRKAAEQQDEQRNQAKIRKKIDRTGMNELFPKETHYSDPLSIAQYEDEINRAEKFFNALIQESKKIKYDVLLADMLQRFVVTRTDVNNILRKAKKAGVINFPDMMPGEQIPKIGKGHHIILN